MIRRFLPTDLDALKCITATCFTGVSIDRNIEDTLGSIGGHDWTWRKLRHIDADVSGDNARHVFVWETSSRAIAGYITGRIDVESKIGRIPNLAVAPQYQGKGIGRKLIDHILIHFRNEGMECAKIETLDQNQIGSTFYPSIGFQEVARQVHYVMRLDESEA
ncbi:MAG: ribosomal protein S18 acetylase RimI-like enzyme [Verrucomicrobiales bacterium]|jgi:ribosomal protein S18 acetylase RimI-like enzyme